jgi:tryptophan 2,3-dioxygenase
MLRPASGFQSYQFKVIEAKLGLKFEDRHGQNYYTSQLKEKDIAIIKDAESSKPVIELINDWLERMPFITEDFWTNYQQVYVNSLAEAEKNNAATFETVFNDPSTDEERNLSPKACRSALFIMMYHGYPMLELPFQLLDTLLEIDNQLSNWRSRHINMVQRMIGTRIGTGGSTGAGYLKAAMDKHYIFKELAQLNSFLVDRKKLPVLPKAVGQKLGYNF